MNENRHFHFDRLLAVACATAALFAFAPRAVAQTEEGWRIRFYAAAIDMESDSASRPASEFGFDMEAGAGLGVHAEYRFSRRLGLDLGVLGGAAVNVASADSWPGVRHWGATQEALTITPLSAGVDIHLMPESRLDLYVCPMVALVRYGGFAPRSSGTGTWADWRLDEDLALGAALGLGVPFGRQKWSFEANLAYLDSSLEGSSADRGRFSANYDSTILGLGFGYRFGRHAG